MKIEVGVKNRLLTTQETYRIPSGSMNDCHIAFHFEPGYGWDELDITAVFTRTDGQMAYRVGIQPDVYVSVPAGILNRPGNIFVGLLGCKGGNTVVTSTTITLNVEANVLNVLNPNAYPVNEKGELDGDAYAQYVAAVNAAAVRAELAADKLENHVCGWYTKAEADERFAQKVKLQTKVYGEFKADVVADGEVPSILVEALPPENIEGNLANPSPLHCIESVSVEMESENSMQGYMYSGFKLRRLNDEIKDALVMGNNGAYKVERVYALKVSDADGEWLDYLTYAVSLVTAPDIAVQHVGSIITNVGDIDLVADEHKIVINFTTRPTTEELNNIEIWYPLDVEGIRPISSNKLGVVPKEGCTIRVLKVVNTLVSTLESFKLMVGLDVTKYLNKYNEDMVDLQNQIDKLQDRIHNLTMRLTGVASAMSLEIKPEDWEQVGPLEYVIQIDDLGVVPVHCRRLRCAAAANNPGILPIDLRQVDPETGIADSFACHVTDIDEDTVEIKAFGIVPEVMTRFTYFAYK